VRIYERHRFPVARRTAVAAACAVLCLAGCQSYEQQPLDLTAHREAFDQRGLSLERIDGFVERLRELGTDIPETFSFDDGLTPPEGEVAALFYNADLRQARLAAGVALASFENAGLWDDPEFGFDGSEIWSPSSPFEFGLMVSLTIPVSGRLEVEKSRAGAAYEAELRRIVNAEWELRGQVRQAWAAWTAAVERARLLRDATVQVERITSITDRLEAAGELSRIEARLFRVELAARRAEIADVILEVRQARIELLGLMGLPPNATIELLPALPTIDLTCAGDVVGRLIEANTELAIRRAEYQTAEESLRLEVRKQYPDIEIGGGYGREGDDRLLLGLSLPIPILNANRAGIAEARAERDVALAAAETTFERLARALAYSQAALDAAQAQRVRYESEVVPMLEEQAAEVESIAQLGEVDTLILLETVHAELDAKSRLLDLRLSEFDAATAITLLLGPDEAADPAPINDDPDDGSTSVDGLSSAVGDLR